MESEKDKLKRAIDKSKIKCFLCGKMGHYKPKCVKGKSKKGTSKQLEKEDTILMTIVGNLQPRKDIWIADLAALTHIVNSKVGLYNVKSICEFIKIGDGKLVYATKVGQLKVSYKAYEGKTEEFILENVQYIPSFWISLFSLTVAITKGCSISNEGRMVVVEKGALKIQFDEEIKTKMVLYVE